MASLSSFFNLVGPLFFGAAVADTVSRLVSVPAIDMPAVIGAALSGAIAWNIVAWLRGLPSSSSHALVGGLVGAALLDSGPKAVNWGGLAGVRPVGVLGILLVMAAATVSSLVAAYAIERLLLRTASHLSRRAVKPVRLAQWGTSAWLSFSHGSNDTMKTVGVMAALLLAAGHTGGLAGAPWVIVAASVALTAGTAFGGWAIADTLGRRIFRLRQLDSLTSQAVSAAIILGASGIGAPVSTSQVVATSIVGIGGGRHRWNRVDWAIVEDIGLAWLTTMPASAILAAIALPIWRLV